ncbi:MULTISPECIES: hypothetical protein [unclassified Luteibacter]|uniref:hypothetical protein n=1 Tax=Luteibacter sp. PvP019 TaxID=3156436 RepID=UPI00339354D8
MRCDARVSLYLLPSSECGFLSDIPVGVFHGIIMFDDSRGYDFRTDIGVPFLPGSSRELAIAFLSPNDVSHILCLGVSFNVWAGRIVGHGKILRSFI